MPQTKLPEYRIESLRALNCDELIDQIITDSDTTPRNVIDECARRGEEMLAILANLEQNADPDPSDSGLQDGEWWLLIHAVHILGLMKSASAGELLLSYLSKLGLRSDADAYWQYLAGYWPALMRNKPAHVRASIKDIWQEPRFTWRARNDLTQIYVDQAYKQGPKTLDIALDWLASIAANEDYEHDFRRQLSITLFAFPRPRFRALLNRQALQYDINWYKIRCIARSFTRWVDQPTWRNFDDPWQFYQPQEIHKRVIVALQRIVASLEQMLDYTSHPPHIRDQAKIGRNEPCPCGSGKKYKQCCL